MPKEARAAQPPRIAAAGKVYNLADIFPEASDRVPDGERPPNVLWRHSQLFMNDVFLGTNPVFTCEAGPPPWLSVVQKTSPGEGLRPNSFRQLRLKFGYGSKRYVRTELQNIAACSTVRQSLLSSLKIVLPMLSLTSRCQLSKLCDPELAKTLRIGVECRVCHNVGKHRSVVGYDTHLWDAVREHHVHFVQPLTAAETFRE